MNNSQLTLDAITPFLKETGNKLYVTPENFKEAKEIADHFAHTRQRQGIDIFNEKPPFIIIFLSESNVKFPGIGNEGKSWRLNPNPY